MTAQRIADLEHDANQWVPAVVPLGSDPDHCDQCRKERDRRVREARQRERQANCAHDDTIEIRQMCDPGATRICTDCGKRLEEDT